VVFGMWVSHGLSRVALNRVRVAFGHTTTEDESAADAAPPHPVPLTLHDVGYRYPHGRADALADVSLTVAPGELVAIVGPNGSGKSTLARIVAGRRAPTTGSVARAGAVGLGRPGGTAIVFQRPEAQVLGVRVADDVVWGLPDASDVDIPAVLTRVGLADFADRETSTLSGGELQRLAIAAALARAPQLLVSDESTAMVDQVGRGRVVALLEQLARAGTAVMHVTHYPNEATRADRVVALDHGRVVPTPPSLPEPAPRHARAAGARVAPVIELEGVGHIYSRRSPWAHRALEDVSLTIREGESVLVVGHNGSGKSTLAWIIAGLLVPSEGRASLVEIDGSVRPEAASIGRVGLAFQHARLQLLRPTVGNEVRVGAGIDDAQVIDALRSVGLDASIAERRVDELSGGQLRRVVLAEVLATRPRAIVLDEPFAGLDLEARADLERLLVRVRDEHRVALVIVSHDYDLPPALVERVVELEAGRVVRDDRVDDVVGEATS
jgi:energy-coupling factor transport system ATP-binding protein